MTGWSFRIVDISQPTFTDIRVAFEILDNGTQKGKSEIVLSADECIGKNAVQILSLASTKINQKCTPYKIMDAVYSGLQAYKNQEYAVS